MAKAEKVKKLVTETKRDVWISILTPRRLPGPVPCDSSKNKTTNFIQTEKLGKKNSQGKAYMLSSSDFKNTWIIY